MKFKKTVLSIISFAGILLIIYFLTQRSATEKQYASEGLHAPDIRLSDAASGRKILLSELKGKVVFINFWASWCKPCRDEMPSIERLFTRFMDKQDFVVVTILYRDDPQNGLGYLRQNNFNFPLMIDDGGKAAKSYGVTGVPETYIVDKKSILRKKVIGSLEWDSPEATAYISGLLGE